MKSKRILALSCTALFLGGCASPGIVGTWTGRGDAGDAPFSFGSASFVGDNTFTAEARYGQSVRVQSGTWNATGDQLSLRYNAQERQYSYQVDGDELTVTDPQSGNSVTLDRLRR
jgi:uncharacterized lipoprotein NlpE involved in copper resistance